jgi:N-acyl-D-amino-acid deacylase
VLCSYNTGPGGSDGRERRQALEAFCVGRDVTGLAQVRSSGLVFGLQSGLPIANRGATWNRLRALPLAERLAAIRDEGMRALVEEAKQHGFKRNLGTPGRARLLHGQWPVARLRAGEELNLIAMGKAGEHWSETFLRITRESGGKALFTLRMFNPEHRGAGAHVPQRRTACRAWAIRAPTCRR